MTTSRYCNKCNGEMIQNKETLNWICPYCTNAEKKFKCPVCECVWNSGEIGNSTTYCPKCMGHNTYSVGYCINDEPEQAEHFDENKPRVDLLPPDTLMEVARVLAFGANKYGELNWLNGMPWRKLVGSILRHIFKWMMGKDNDEESGINHLAHAACDTLMLLTYVLRGIGTDNRVK